MAAVLFGNAQNPRKFEVASIKPSAPDSGTETRRYPGGRFTATGVTLKRLIQRGYEVQDFQIDGGPKWVNSERYDVVAKAGENLGLDPQIDSLIQALLADRFQLKFHRETREMLTYSLTADKSGPKLHANTTAPGPRWSLERGLLTGQRIPMSMFASDMLTKALGSVVVDHTGLAGNFDLELKWIPDEARSAVPRIDKDSDSASSRDIPGPSIFAAIRDQLGLKLEAHKGPVEVLVIDGAERPTEN
jgi:uncharacterized protein (TIGR03435 family)